MGIKANQWGPYLAELYRMCKHGGYIQGAESHTPKWKEGDVDENFLYAKVPIFLGLVNPHSSVALCRHILPIGESKSLLLT
jgi:hypothetical protein